jgi:hypothetical protein
MNPDKLPLQQGENILYEVRSYLLTYFLWFMLAGGCIGVSFFFMFQLFKTWWGQIIFILLISIGLFLLVRLFFYWKKNTLVVTTHGIIDIHYKSLINKVISRVNFDEITDISGQIEGFFGVIFRYGNLKIKTEDESVEIIKNKVKYPVDIQTELKDLKRKYNRRDDQDPIELVAEQIDHLSKTELIKTIQLAEKKLEKVKEK